MSELFNDDEEDLVDEEFDSDEQIPVAKSTPATLLAARKRLEKMLEERRVRLELGDFEDLQ